MRSLKELYRIGSGPSSSHTMGPENASLYMLENYPHMKYKASLYGSLALTGKGHLTDAIIKKTLGEDTEVLFDYKKEVDHPNTMTIEAYNDKESHIVTFTSIGGGEILVDGERLKESNDCYPFKNFKEMQEYCQEERIGLEEIVYRFDSEDIKDYLKDVYHIMVDSVKRGLKTEGLLPGPLKVKRKAKSIYASIMGRFEKNLRDLIIPFAYATSEENASGGTIVTAPTCGASGVLPASLYYAELNGIQQEKIIDALAVAGLIGNTIKTNASISGAYLGCQAEVGAACSMAAGAISFLYNGTPLMIGCASEIAMEHHLGLTCDPVNGLVQIPCIERNAIAALRAVDAAKMSSLPIYPEKITFDMVVEAMLETGKDIKEDYKETAKGGLALQNLGGEYYED